jgi:hypothetical protein
MNMAISRTESPWSQIQRIYDEAAMETRMKDLGFRESGLPQERLGFSRVWVQDGAPRRLLHHLASRGFRDLADQPGGWGFVGSALLLLTKLNALTKQLQLTLSLFHHFAQFESYIAGSGLGAFNIPAMVRGWSTAMQKLRSGAALPWAKAGMEMATKRITDPNIAEDSLGKLLNYLENAAGKFWLTRYTAAPVVRTIKALHTVNNYILWDVIQPGMKIQLADRMLAEAMMDFPDATEADLRRDIANMVNDLFGGQNFTEYLWATPMVQDTMRLFFLAPDWTISAINTARLGEMMNKVLQTDAFSLGKATATGYSQKFLIQRYWPTFIALLLIGIPNVLQYLLWLFNQKSENPDPNMQPFAMMNETERQFHVDATPFLKAFYRKMGREYPPNRRFYFRWGKQAYELGRWFTDFQQSLLTKGSVVMRTAYEQITGKSTAGWDMPWVRMADLSDSARTFGDSKLAHLGRQFLPMTVLTWLDGRPSLPFTAVSMGMSKTRAAKELRNAFSMYAEDSFFDRIKGSPVRVKKLEQLVPDVIDALVRNGYGPEVKQIVGTALGTVGSRYTWEIANELQQNPDAPDEKKIAKVLAKYKRLDKGWQNLTASMDKQLMSAKKFYTPEQRKAQREALSKAWKSTLEERPGAF